MSHSEPVSNVEMRVEPETMLLYQNINRREQRWSPCALALPRQGNPWKRSKGREVTVHAADAQPAEVLTPLCTFIREDRLTRVRIR